MLDRLRYLVRKDPQRAQRRADRAALRAERRDVHVERSAADLDAEARHYSSLHQGNLGGGAGSGPFGGS